MIDIGQIIVFENSIGFLAVYYTSTYCNHGCNIGYHSLIKKELASIPG